MNKNNERNIIPVGMGPLDVRFDQKTNKIYVANIRDNTVSIIDPKTDRVVGKILVGRGPDGVAVDPTTSKAYVANLGDNTTSIIDLKTDRVVDNVPLALQVSADERTPCPETS